MVAVKIDFRQWYLKIENREFPSQKKVEKLMEDFAVSMLFISYSNDAFGGCRAAWPLYWEKGRLEHMSKVDRKNNSVLSAFMEIKATLAASVVRVLVNPDDVEDVLQETYLLVCAQAGKSDIQSVKGYFFRVARNVALKDLARRSKANFKSLEEMANFEPPSEEVGVDDRLHFMRKLETLMAVIQTLPPKCRQAFLLKKVMGLSQKEIAKKMGIAESTVEKHLITAMRRTVATMNAKGYEVGSDRTLVDIRTYSDQENDRQTHTAQRF